jgi:hypothetical protein
MGTACSMHGPKRDVYRVLVGMQEGPPGRLDVGRTVILRWVVNK